MRTPYIYKVLCLAGVTLLFSCGHSKPKVEQKPAEPELARMVRGVKFCYVRGGSFDHRGVRHTVSADFRLSETEVTNAQYCAFLNDLHVTDTCRLLSAAGPQGLAPVRGQLLLAPDTLGCEWNEAERRWEPSRGHANFPMVHVTWYGAKAYCLWMGGDLPTEAQWELACQGNECTDQTAWTISSKAYSTHAVATVPAASYGLYDMLGNVWEWCDDRFDTVYVTRPLTNYRGPQKGTQRVYRGGSWVVGSQYCTPEARRACIPDYHINDLGFRVCLP